MKRISMANARASIVAATLGTLWCMQVQAVPLSSLADEEGSFGIFAPDVSTVVPGGDPVNFIGDDVADIDASIPNVGNIDWTLDVNGLQMLLGFDDRDCCTGSAVFAGPVINFASAVIASLTLVSSNIVGFDASRLSFSGGNIYVNLANGLDLRNNRSVVLALTANDVPEPGTFALLGLGLLTAGGLRRRNT